MTKPNPIAWRNTEKKVYVVLPSYNEAQNLPKLLERIDEALWEDSLKYEIIIVDDGSQDETAELVEKYSQTIPLRFIQHKVNQGLGCTIRDGLEVAAGICGNEDIVVAMDADNSHTPGLIRSMVRCIKEGNDVVIASRYRTGAYIRGVPFYRILLSYASRFLFQLCFPIPGVRDYTCGYRAYRGRLLKKAFQKYGREFVDRDGFEAMVDILLKLRKMDAIFREVPLILRYDEKKGGSKMNVGRTIRRSLSLIIERRFFATKEAPVLIPADPFFPFSIAQTEGAAKTRGLGNVRTLPVERKEPLVAPTPNEGYNEPTQFSKIRLPDQAN